MKKRINFRLFNEIFLFIIIFFLIIPLVLATVYTIVDVSSSGIYEDVVAENNFTHLNISDQAPYDSLVLYLPFDYNSSLNSSSDYSSSENNATIFGASTSSFSNFILNSSFSTNNHLQGIAYDGEYIYITYGGNGAVDNVIEKRYENGTIVDSNDTVYDEDYELAGAQMINGSLYVAINGYEVAGSGINNNKIAIVNTTTLQIESIIEDKFSGDYLEGIDFFNNSYWIVYDNEDSRNTIVEQYSSSWDFIANYSLRTDLSGHKYQGISWWSNDSGSNFIFVNIHENTYPGSLDKYLWNGTGFTLVASYTGSDNFGHQDIDIYNNTFRWIRRSDNKSSTTTYYEEGVSTDSSSSIYLDSLYGNGINFTDDVYLTTPLNNFDYTAGTISLWVKLNSLSDYEWLFSEQGTGNNNDEIEIYVKSGGEVRMLVWGGRTLNEATTPTISTNNWTHFVLTWNSSSVCGYKNGANTGSCDTSVTLPDAKASTAYYGTRATKDYWTDGLIDELMIFNTSLTSSQISDIYNNQSARFKPQGNHSISKNITSGNNRINITTDYEALIGSSINLTLWYYDGSWNSAGTQIVDGDNSFNISISTTNITLNYTYLSDSNQFYSPLLKNDITLETYSDEEADTTYPIISLVSPSNNSASNGNQTFKFNVTDSGGIANCSLILDGSVNSTDESITVDINQTFSLTLSAGAHNWSINCSDNAGNQNSSETRTIIVVKSLGFSGNSTDFSQYNSTSIQNITNLILEKPSYGRINFSSSVNLSGGKDLDAHVTISDKSISINSTALPELNTTAELSFYGVTYTTPGILKDGETCPSTICQEVIYSSNNYIVNVTSFSTYTVTETYSAPATEEETPTSSGGGYPIYYLTESSLKEGYSKVLGKNWKLKFNLENESHELKVDDIQNNSATITISSNPITFNLSINQTKKIDLDNNGFYDISVLLKNTTGNTYYPRAEVYIKSINEEILKDQTETLSQNIKENKLIYSVIGIVLIAIAMILLILRFKPKKKKK